MMKRKQAFLIITAGILCTAGSLALSRIAVGISFLLIITALLGIAVSLFGLSFLPQRGTKLFPLARILRTTMLCILSLWLVSLVVVEFLIVGHSGKDAYTSEKYVFVLGAGVYGETPSLALTYRLQTSLAFLEAHPDTIAVLCGSRGSGESITEAEAMSRWLVKRGINENRLLLEEESHNTLENIGNAVQLLQAKNGAAPASVVIITNDFHVWRAKLIAKRFGITAAACPAPTPTIGLVNVSLYLREYFSLLFFLFK